MNPLPTDNRTQDHPDDQTLGAFYDGELDGEHRSLIQTHLGSCEACARRVEQFRGMAVLIASAPPAALSQIALRRLHNKLDEVIERGLVRWAWEVSGVAAAILLVGSVWLARIAEPATATASGVATAVVPPWVSAQASADPVVQIAPTPAAAWYLADARDSSEINP
jgi:anti-sigma factor RsiW